MLAGYITAPPPPQNGGRLFVSGSDIVSAVRLHVRHETASYCSFKLNRSSYSSAFCLRQQLSAPHYQEHSNADPLSARPSAGT
jgi:hypothetical protein